MNHELANWKQSQRMFNWEDDRGKAELNTIQQWFEALSELLWRSRLLSKQVGGSLIATVVLQASIYRSSGSLITTVVLQASIYRSSGSLIATVVLQASIYRSSGSLIATVVLQASIYRSSGSLIATVVLQVKHSTFENLCISDLSLCPV